MSQPLLLFDMDHAYTYLWSGGDVCMMKRRESRRLEYDVVVAGSLLLVNMRLSIRSHMFNQLLLDHRILDPSQ